MMETLRWSTFNLPIATWFLDTGGIEILSCHCFTLATTLPVSLSADFMAPRRFTLPPLPRGTLRDTLRPPLYIPDNRRPQLWRLAGQTVFFNTIPLSMHSKVDLLKVDKIWG